MNFTMQKYNLQKILQKKPKWWNPAKLYKKKAPKNRREKETKSKDQSPGRQKSPKEVSHTKVRELLK